MVKNRFGFTMIELIFAIVVISIAVLSLPMMVQVNSKLDENSIVQEAIFAASAELMGASAGYWDTNSMEDSNLSSVSRVIDIEGNCDSNRLRVGHINQPLHRRCVESSSGAVADSANSEFVNLDNAEHSSSEIFLNPNPQSSGYKKSYTSKVDVTRTNDIKYLQVSVSDEDGIIVVLKMQSANVGEIDYYKRRF